MNYILSAAHIQKKYGGNTVLRDVSMHVARGGIYGLVGKNGSGKTTLLRILTGQIQDYSGTVSVGGAKIAAIINDPALFLNMSAFDNLKEQAHLLGLRGDAKIDAALRMVGLEQCGRKPVKQFSLGMTQRLKLALALLERPDILILDEPINGLDPEGIAGLRALLRDLNRSGITMIISSHILSELEQTATCLGILHDGKIVKELTMREIAQAGMRLEEQYMRYTGGQSSW